MARPETEISPKPKTAAGKEVKENGNNFRFFRRKKENVVNGQVTEKEITPKEKGTLFSFRRRNGENKTVLQDKGKVTSLIEEAEKEAKRQAAAKRIRKGELLTLLKREERGEISEEPAYTKAIMITGSLEEAEALIKETREKIALKKEKKEVEDPDSITVFTAS